MVEFAGLGSIILMGLNIWAFISILSSNATAGSKALWCLLVLVLPLLGFIIWLFAGPRGETSTA